MNKYAKSITVLLSICLVVSILMAAVNYVTAPVIKKAEAEAANDSLKVVMPDGEGFEKFDFSSYKLPSTVKEVYKEKNGGYVFKLETSGYSTGLAIMCGVYASGEVSGCTVLANSETPSVAGKVIENYGEALKGATSQTVMQIDTVGGATKTSTGYRGAVKDALDAFAILGGADVDLRTEEEILQDNLKAALPAGDEFELVFVAEVLDGVDTVYSAKNGEGYVFVCGEIFVGTDAQGKVSSEASAELKTKVESAAEKMLASESAEVDISALEGIAKSVDKVEKTASGNYILSLKASGYGKKGQYHASGAYIRIKVSITPEGKIINCYTVSQKESENYGAACGEYKFYSQFNGKDETNYDGIDAITGATVTTNGYKDSIKAAFDAVKILVREGM